MTPAEFGRPSDPLYYVHLSSFSTNDANTLAKINGSEVSQAVAIAIFLTTDLLCPLRPIDWGIRYAC